MTKLDELERLLAKATPGPWARCHDTVVLAEDGFTTVCGLASDDIGTGADIAAIAALRNLAPKLIAVAREAEEVADEFKREHPLAQALAALEEP
jgi:hypothetical protein